MLSGVVAKFSNIWWIVFGSISAQFPSSSLNCCVFFCFVGGQIIRNERGTRGPVVMLSRSIIAAEVREEKVQKRGAMSRKKQTSIIMSLELYFLSGHRPQQQQRSTDDGIVIILDHKGNEEGKDWWRSITRTVGTRKNTSESSRRGSGIVKQRTTSKYKHHLYPPPPRCCWKTTRLLHNTEGKGKGRTVSNSERTNKARRQSEEEATLSSSRIHGGHSIWHKQQEGRRMMMMKMMLVKKGKANYRVQRSSEMSLSVTPTTNLAFFAGLIKHPWECLSPPLGHTGAQCGFKY